MGVQDREWYWEERRRKEKLHYNPKFFRRPRSAASATDHAPGPTSSTWRRAALLFLAIIGIAFFVAQWRSHDMATRRMAEAAEKEQKLRLQALEKERIELAEMQARAARHQREEANRLRAISAQREGAQRAQTAEIDEQGRRAELWKKFYKPAPGCERSATVECANAFIRARRQFDESYGKRLP